MKDKDYRNEQSEPSQKPWNIQFSWSDKHVEITLKDGNDLLKIGELLSDLLTKNGIENTLEKY